MDVHEWLQHVDNRDFPGTDADEQTLHRHGHVVRQRSERHDTRSAEADRKPPMQVEKPIRTAMQHGYDVSAASSESSSSSSSELYRRKPRRKTRNDRYELKRKKRKNSPTSERPIRKIKKTRAARDETKIARDFQLNSRTREHRLTLEPSRAGLFSRGRTVGIAKMSTGSEYMEQPTDVANGTVPDLSFNELEFLQEPLRIHTRLPDPEQSAQTRNRAERDAKVSAYFTAADSPVAARLASSPDTTSIHMPSMRRQSVVRHANTPGDPRLIRRTTNPGVTTELVSSTSMLLPRLSIRRQRALPAVSEPEEWRSQYSSDIKTAAELPRPSLRDPHQASIALDRQAGTHTGSLPSLAYAPDHARLHKNVYPPAYAHGDTFSLHEQKALGEQYLHRSVEMSQPLSDPVLLAPQQCEAQRDDAAIRAYLPPGPLHARAQPNVSTEMYTRASEPTALVGLPIRGLCSLGNTAELRSPPALSVQAARWHGRPMWQEEGSRLRQSQQVLGTNGDMTWLQSPTNIEGDTPESSHAEPLSSLKAADEVKPAIATPDDLLATFWKPNRLY